MTAEDGERIEASVVAALYVEHSAELHRFLTGVLRDPQLASDVLQTTFIRLVEQGHRTRQQSRKAWLFRVAYHEALAVRRRESVGHRVMQRAAWGHTMTSDAADQPIIRFESVEAVRKAIDELPLEQQQIVRKRIYEEKTFAVIAGELGIPLGTALGRMRSALRHMRIALKNLDG